MFSDLPFLHTPLPAKSSRSKPPFDAVRNPTSLQTILRITGEYALVLAVACHMSLLTAAWHVPCSFKGFLGLPVHVLTLASLLFHNPIPHPSRANNNAE